VCVIAGFRVCGKNDKRRHRPKTGTLCVPREFPSVARESRAQTHTTMKRAYLHTETLQVSCITPPCGKRIFHERFFYTSKPASRVQHESREDKTCELYQNVTDGTAPPMERIIACGEERCKTGDRAAIGRLRNSMRNLKIAALHRSTG